MSPSRSFTLSNWLEPPFNREAFQRVRELAPTALIRRRDHGPNVLDRDPVDLDRVTFRGIDGAAVNWETQLERSCGDAVCVVHDGRMVYERYLNTMTDRTPHLLMSVSKSWCGAALGIAVGRGLLSMTDLVTEIGPEFADTSLDGATVRHVIDMTAGTGFVEDYDDYSDPNSDTPLIEYERQAGYRPLGGRPAVGMLAHFRSYPRAYPHGAWFSYRSPLTNVAARLLEVVHDMRYADIVTRDLWGPLGQEHDADIMVDAVGQAVVEGGMSCTLRDLARLGLAYLDNGVVGGVVGSQRVLPEAWITDTRIGDDAALAAYAASPDHAAEPAWTMYRNGWWVERAGEVLSGLGIFGQYCWVDRPSRTVIARFSTYPSAMPTALEAETLRGFRAVAEALASRP